MGKLPPNPNRQPAAKSAAAQQNPQLTQWLQQGIGLHQQGQLSQAKEVYERILALQPEHFDSLHMLGVIAYQTGNLALAADLIGKAIQINPNIATAYSNWGNALKELKRLEDALASYDKAIALQPDYAEAFNNRGNALDDFGTGFSSLSYLQRLPISELKIDRSFVAQLENSERDAKLASGIICIAHDLGVKVVAEGVETAAQLDRLRDFGCDAIQGFVFQRPLAAAGFASLLAPDFRFKDPGRS